MRRSACSAVSASPDDLDVVVGLEQIPQPATNTSWSSREEHRNCHVTHCGR